MRKRFDQQLSADIVPISDVHIPLNSRDELPPVLAGLQYIFSTPELNRQVFDILEKKILKDKKKTGRKGMDLWEILVLATVRLSLNTNYDRLHHLSNYDKLIRGILGVESSFDKGKQYNLRTIKDNVKLLDEDTLIQINTLVVNQGHKLLKKNEGLQVKADTYVLETNVHFPTDLNLLWDSARKCLDMIGVLRADHQLKGWRKIKHWKRQIKSGMRSSGKACSGGGKNKEQRIRQQVGQYLNHARDLKKKLNETILQLYQIAIDGGDLLLEIKLQQLDNYHDMLNKFIDQVDRRLLQGQTIATDEKIYSIFEPHTNWITKGKKHRPVELGHKLLVATDQFNFILLQENVGNTADVHLAVPMVDKLVLQYGQIDSLSLDKGFFSKDNKELVLLEIPVVNMPKKGKPNQQEKLEESTKSFKQLRNRHSAIEANINQLEHNGLDKCPDKGLNNFKLYTALGVLSYNLHRLGKVLLEKAAAQHKKQAA